MMIYCEHTFGDKNLGLHDIDLQVLQIYIYRKDVRRTTIFHANKALMLPPELED